MSVFDPNKDYTNENNLDPESLYETVMQVQQLLQDITVLMQMPDEEESSFKMRPRTLKPEIFEDECPLYEEKEETNSPFDGSDMEMIDEDYGKASPINIYDNIF
jgi:hypothetical protein